MKNKPRYIAIMLQTNEISTNRGYRTVAALSDQLGKKKTRLPQIKIWDHKGWERHVTLIVCKVDVGGLKLAG